MQVIRSLSTSHNLRCATLFSRSEVSSTFPAIIEAHLLYTPSWSYSASVLDCPTFGDSVAASRWHCVLTNNAVTSASHAHLPSSSIPDILANFLTDPPGYGHHINPSLPTNFPITLPTFPNTSNETTTLSQPHAIHTSAPYSSVFDPDYPIPEPDANVTDNTPFSPGCGIVFTCPHTNTRLIRQVHPIELASAYSLDPASTEHRRHAFRHYLKLPLHSISPILRTTLPLHTASAIASTLVEVTLCNLFDTAGTAAENVLSCVIRSALPTPDAWTSGYSTDPTLEPIYTALTANPSHVFPETFLQTLPSSYQTPLRDGLISLCHGRLTYTYPLNRNRRSLLLIVPPALLRRSLFSALHSPHSAGHPSACKTLHRIRLRFHWHKLRSDVDTWLNECPACILANTHPSRNGKLALSQPVSSPFSIIHVEIWQPSNPDYLGGKHFLTAMCNLTGYSIIADIPWGIPDALAKLFTKRVLLRVSTCLVVAPHAGSPFFSHFEEMCTSLNLPCKPTPADHRTPAHMERLFRCLDKAVALAITHHTDDTRISPNVVHLANYAWNASPIDGTAITRSVPAVGRQFRFPLDNDLSALPDIPPDDLPITNLHEFLRLGHHHSPFATEILRHLTKYRRVASTECSLYPFSIGDIVTSSTQVRSNATNGTTAKLTYRRHGPFRVLTDLQHDDKYRVQSTHDGQTPSTPSHLSSGSAHKSTQPVHAPQTTQS